MATRQRKRRLDFGRVNVIGVIGTVPGFRRAARLGPGMLDAVEARLDFLGGVPRVLARGEIALPVIATARHPAEGGHGGLPAQSRRRLLEEALAFAIAIDVELRAAAGMRGLLERAEGAGVARILSFHDFKTTPSLNRLVEMMERARDAGADVFKVATTARGPGDLAVLLALQERARMPLAAMAMGRYGRASRLVLGACGSVLNYGWIERPQVSGQWSVTELHGRLRELGAR